MSQGQAMRSTLAFFRVTHFTMALLLETSHATMVGVRLSRHNMRWIADRAAAHGERKRTGKGSRRMFWSPRSQDDHVDHETDGPADQRRPPAPPGDEGTSSLRKGRPGRALRRCGTAASSADE